MSLFKFGFEKLPLTGDSLADSSSSENRPSVDNTSKDNAHNSDESESEKEAEKNTPAKRVKREPARKYDEDYLKFGFICAGTDELPLPLCLVCKKTLANSSMKPHQLIRHLKSNHDHVKEKPLEYFQRLKDDHKFQVKDISNYSKSELNGIKSSFVAAYHIAKEKKPYTTGEQLIKPVLVDITRIMFGESAVAKMNTVPLSADTIKRRVTEMSSDIKNQLSSHLKDGGNFCLQFDESTDIAGEAILIGFVRYILANAIVEDIFCFCSLPERTTGDEIFRAIDAQMNEYGLNWKNCVGVCTDGAAAMTGRKCGLVTTISTRANANFSSTHCVLHREALAAKKLSVELNTTLHETVQMINSIKMKPLHARIFSAICVEMNSEHQILLLHSEIRWLSRGKVLNRVYELKAEMITHFERYLVPILEKRRKQELARKKQKKPPNPVVKLSEECFLECLKDDQWVANLAYLANVFDRFNELNLQTQGRHANCFGFYNKIEAFQKKLAMWKQEAERNEFSAFPFIGNLLSHNKPLIEHIQPIIVSHLEQLLDHFRNQFPDESDPRKDHLWVVEPFLNSKEENTLTNTEKCQLLGEYLSIFSRSCSIIFCLIRTIWSLNFWSFFFFSTDLVSDPTLKNSFGSVSLEEFWLSVKTGYKELSYKAMNKLLQFSTTYLCESAFSTMTLVKTKQRNRLNAESAMFVAISRITPRIEELSKGLHRRTHTFK